MIEEEELPKDVKSEFLRNLHACASLVYFRQLLLDVASEFVQHLVEKSRVAHVDMQGVCNEADVNTAERHADVLDDIFSVMLICDSCVHPARSPTIHFASLLLDTYAFI